MTTPTCINLQERFGRRCRVSWEADGATRFQWPEADRPWLMEIRCHRGVVYPVGGDILAAVGRGPRTCARLRALPGLLTVRGDLEPVVTFPADQAEAVLSVLKPYRRRQVSAGERERLRRIGFQRERSAAHSDGVFPALESTHAAPRRATVQRRLQDTQ